MKQLLLRIGIIRLKRDGSVRWPVRLVTAPHIWKAQWRGMFVRNSWISPFGVFRNRREFVKWEKGRLLPRRWGFHIFGLEIGDRG